MADFIINQKNESILDRFKTLIKDTEFFDVLVAYFRTSGFFQLYESLEPVSKIRILVGINVDRKTYELIDESRLKFHSSKETKRALKKRTKEEMENSEDNIETEKGVKKFIEFLMNKKLEFRAYPRANIHAKVYISRFSKGSMDPGRVITGSSNFSESGFIDNLEFNVELKDKSDVKFALEKFEELWQESIDLTKDYVETIKTETWLSDDITPYEIYLKFLYEYFKEDIDLDNEKQDVYLPEGFKDLKYQLQAVTSAKKILDAYNGVFLADVVGLGKTFISALLAQKLRGKILVICPPGLKDYWYDTFRDFGVRSFDVESQGKLDHVTRKGVKYDYVFIDEAHRFRNEGTTGYEKLHEICFGKKVILVSATPLNNTIDDIYSQIKLFQIPRKSTIPGISDLEAYFTGLRKRRKGYRKGDPEHTERIKETSKDMRDKVLRHIMVRRTRREISNYFASDLKSQGLDFPEIGNPRRVVYKFDSTTQKAFYETIKLLKKFKYSRYTPLLYLKEGPTQLEKQSQRNLSGFMKGLLVKRLESSKYAFIKTVKRFIKSYENFIEMYEKGMVYISREVDVYEYLDRDDEEKLISLTNDPSSQSNRYESEKFKSSFPVNLDFDLKLLRKIKSLWTSVDADPKLEEFICELKSDATLKNNKLIIFTESKETGDYLYDNLNGVFPGEVFFYSSHGGKYENSSASTRNSMNTIKENFDPNSKIQKDDFRLLISTDILAEGINLHRSNTVVNYDLPWNPTRVLQRVGRINRIGTEHMCLHVYNIFPTSESDEHLGLEVNIKSKISAFHETLGADAKYITEEEQPVAHELFGDKLFRDLNDKKTYEGEEEEQSDLKYLKILRDTRDGNALLFERIKQLPKKARTAQFYKADADRLITFFRKGDIKKILITEGNESRELSFFEAADYFECSPDTKGIDISSDYYRLLNINKKGFSSLTSGEITGRSQTSSRSNEAYIIRRLRAKEMRTDLTEEDEEFVKKVISTFEYGIIPKKTSQKLKKSLEMESCPEKIILMLKDAIPYSLLKVGFSETGDERSQVVLSQYLSAGD